MAQKERENFYRYSTMLVDHGTESLSAVMENDLSNTNMTFEKFINNHQHKIYHLCYKHCCHCKGQTPHHRSILHPSQLEILLDKSGTHLAGHIHVQSGKFQYCCRPAKKSLSVSNLDITLLRCLLLNFAQNYNANPTLRKDIEDLVECRNKLYGHIQTATLSDTDYAKYKTDVEGIILRIARFCNIENEMLQKLNDASQRPLDETILIQYQTTLMQQSERDKEIEEKVDKLQQQSTLQDERLHCRMDTMEGKVSEVGQRKRNIIAQTEARLLEHAKDDTYIVTEDVRTCCEILEKYKTLIIIAKAGGGKSKTCYQIATMYQDKLYKPMLFVHDEILRNRDLINFDDQNIVIIEDLFGRSNIEDLHTGLLDVLNSCIKTKSCKSKLIITIRGNDEISRKLIERHTLFDKNVCINLDKNRSVHSKESILLKHMKINGILLCKCKRLHSPFTFSRSRVFKECTIEVIEKNDNTTQMCISLLTDISKGNYELNIGFPQACQLFCSNKTLTKQGITYFKHASKSLLNEIMHLKTQGFSDMLIQYKYCVLVYGAIKGSIDVNNIDDKCFQHILLYFESNNIKMSLLKEAVRGLEGIYITKKFSLSDRGNIKRSNLSDIYVLQNKVLQDALLVSYGDDADILTVCGLDFLIEYIRPKEYQHYLDEHIVLLFCDYKLIVTKLISMLSTCSTDDITFTTVGCYLELVALVHRRDEIMEFFFQNLEDIKSNEYACLVNGLTSFGSNPALVKFHPNLCKDIMKHAGMQVFCAFCRPIGWTENNTNFVEIETDLLINKLYLILDTSRIEENCQESKENKGRVQYSFDCKGSRYNVGNYLFEYLIEKGLFGIVESFFEKLKENLQKIIPIHVKEFLDGLLDGGKRSTIVSQYEDFFEAVLFKYGSISTIVHLCIPSTSTCLTMNNPNSIRVDDTLLIGKLSGYFETAFAMECSLKKRLPVVSKEDWAYFIYNDDYFDKMTYILIAEYIIEHGFKSNNDRFVQMMYVQLASEYFADYPSDEIWEDENGMKLEFVENKENPSSHVGTTKIRLFEVLRSLEPHLKICMKSESKLMALLKKRFKSLLNHINYDVGDTTACMSNV